MMRQDDAEVALQSCYFNLPRDSHVCDRGRVCSARTNKDIFTACQWVALIGYAIRKLDGNVPEGDQVILKGGSG